ncbi:PREDICTED: phenylalanine--tRNA ligase alpha subunit-like [Acropora digitifera]|uniref:phenylalanine--tRNA ligase alpha subunit-like n=1 Tax=Acropora digitifera TaxID=70779 RepID=UPI00077A900B|nr:PREDICTED: phenylalanine--tRNA ligase alpha subunit-like [Acropora digitifera]
MGTQSLDKVVLEALEERGSIETYEFSKELGKDHQSIVGSVKSVHALGDVINVEQRQAEGWVVTEEGSEVVEKGSHEFLVFQAVPPEGLPQEEVKKLGPHANVGFSKAMSAGWLQVNKKAEGGPRVLRKAENVQDDVQAALIRIRDQQVSQIPESKMKELKKRKLIRTQIIKSFFVTKGSQFTTTPAKLEADLTADMLASGAWKEMKFKAYNFDAQGIIPTSGHLHPLMKVRAQFRQIFLEMGFTEMPTNNFVESSFWNFDALFQPQQHPARDAHDTFFMADPKFAKLEEMPQSYIERVKKMHESGGHGSQGYQYDWVLEEAKKNILRTHTTAVSARMLYKLAQQVCFKLLLL